MSKQLKLMILANILVSLFLVVLNLAYDDYGNSIGHIVLWTPLWLRAYNTQALATIGEIGLAFPNFTFYFFWLSTAVNLYFIVRLERNKTPK